MCFCVQIFTNKLTKQKINYRRFFKMAFTQYTCDKFLDELFGKTDFTAPTTIYVALSTTTPTATGTNVTEPSGSAYARVSVTNNTTNFPSASAGSKSNGTTITFTTATGSWGTVTYFVLYDASTSGNCIGFGALNTAQTVVNGDTLSFAASAMTIGLA
jgi:hypothetical protein